MGSITPPSRSFPRVCMTSGVPEVIHTRGKERDGGVIEPITGKYDSNAGACDDPRPKSVHSLGPLAEYRPANHYACKGKCGPGKKRKHPGQRLALIMNTIDV